MKLLATILLLTVSCLTWGLDIKPYPSAHISVAEWAAYYDEVKKTIGSTEKRSDDHGLVTYSDQDSGTHYAFTLENHPAHPAWIARMVVEQEGHLYIRQIGYFAGNEKAFAFLFSGYQEVNKKWQNELNKMRENNPPNPSFKRDA